MGWHAGNLVLTPHVTSDDLEEYLPKTLDLVFANAARLMHGEPLINALLSPVVSDAIARATGRVETHVLTHSYNQLAPVAGTA